ncbi:MAG TPA: shikimate dehydrogenase [Rhizomicrobium sp.]|jgi:shikimate dehydrogenase
MSAGSRLAGVIGWPARQSLSPRLHGYWLREYGIDGSYVSLAIPEIDFSRALLGIRLAGFAGANITIPHKQAAFAIAHESDAVARAAGAANLLVFRNDRIEARNTDVAGLEASLVEELGLDGLDGKSVVILGAGGAARAAVLACDRLKSRKISVLNRTGQRANGLVHNLSGFVAASIHSHGFEDWARIAPETTLVVHATSAGMDGSASLDLDLTFLPANAFICDLVYRPLETALLWRARQLGLRGIDGLGMLMHQAVPSFEAFYGLRPQVTSALRIELEKALLR